MLTEPEGFQPTFAVELEVNKLVVTLVVPLS